MIFISECLKSEPKAEGKKKQQELANLFKKHSRTGSGSSLAVSNINLQEGVRRNMPRIDFEGSNIMLDYNYATYITMNPGYAGRTELPENLAACFRPVAMMVPDYALIGEIMLFAFGFEKAKECCSNQRFREKFIFIGKIIDQWQTCFVCWTDRYG